jgi:hypothetical protein
MEEGLVTMDYTFVDEWLRIYRGRMIPTTDAQGKLTPEFLTMLKNNIQARAAYIKCLLTNGWIVPPEVEAMREVQEQDLT